MVLGLDADSLERRSAMTDARLFQGADEGPDSPCDTGVPTPEEDTASSRIQVGADALALLDRLCHLSQGNLAERVTYLQALIDAIPSPIFFKDRMGVFVGCNAAFAEGVAGIPKEHVVGRRDEAVWGPSPLVPADGRLERRPALTETNGIQVHTTRVTLPYGTQRWGVVATTDVTDEAGRLSGCVGVMLGLTTGQAAQAGDAERRATRLQTAAEISRAASSILDLDELLSRSVELIQERFSLYYVGVFLLDAAGEWAVLRAGTGSAGERMLAMQHRLRRGGNSMVGACVADASPRIALDVDQWTGDGQRTGDGQQRRERPAVETYETWGLTEGALGSARSGSQPAAPLRRRYANPLLPETRSEMALPLVSRGHVIGAMTIQSELEGAFSEDDITVLQAMADQLANAIQNARLFDRMDSAVRENQILYKTSARIGEAQTIEDLLWAVGDVAVYIGLDSVSLRTFTHWDRSDQHPRGVPVMIDVHGLTNRKGQPELTYESGVACSPEVYEWLFGDGSEPHGANGRHPIVCDDLEKPGQDIPTILWEPFLRRGDRSLVTAPLVARGRGLGVLVLTGSEVFSIPERWRSLPTSDALGSEALGRDALGSDGKEWRGVQIFVRALADQVASALDRQFLLTELGRRASYLGIASEVSRAATSYLDQGRLLSESVGLIQERFGLYYVGILLLDDSGHWAVLRAGSGLAGRTMVEEGYRLPVDLSSRIGVCILGRQVVSGTEIAGYGPEGEAKSEPHGMGNPYLPDARSELVLPLISRGDVLGAMTIQSDELARFSEEDTTVFMTLADQLANAIANARLYEVSQANLDELQRLQQRYAVGMWEEHLERQIDSDGVVGYSYDLNEVSPLMAFEQVDLPRVMDPTEADTRAPVARRGVEGGDGAMLVQALHIRGEPVGLVSFEEPGAVRDWTEDQVMVLDAVREQLELALENRLLIDRSQRALREARQREVELGFLQDVSALLNATSDVAAARHELAARLQEFMAINHLALVSYDTETRRLELLGERNPGERAVYGKPWPLPSPSASGAPIGRGKQTLFDAFEADEAHTSGFRWVVTNRERLTEDDLRLSTRFLEDEHLAAAGVLSRVLLPLVLGSRILGVLELGSPQVNAFARPGLVQVFDQVAAQVASAMERGSLLRAAQTSAEESHRLYEATSDLAEALDASAILEAVVRHGFSGGPARAVLGLFVADPETGAAQDWLEIAASTDSSMAAGARIRVGELPSLRLLADGQLSVCEDIGADPGLPDDLREAYLDSGVGALVVAALSMGGSERLGVLEVRIDSPRKLSEQDLRLYRTIFDQAAVVLSNRRLFQESQERIARQAVAVELAALTTSLSERSALLQEAVGFLRDRFRLYFAGVFLLDDAVRTYSGVSAGEGQWAVLQAGTGEVGERLMLMGHRVQVGGASSVGRCARSGERVLTLDVDSSAALLENPLLPETRSLAVLPLVSRGQINGVITLHSQRRFAFSQEDVATLELMVNQLANVVESTNLYERSQSSLAETRMLYRIAQQITDARDTRSVLTAAVEGISQRSEPDWIVAGLLDPAPRTGQTPTSLRVAVSWSREGATFPVESFEFEKVRQFSEVLRLDERFVTPDITQDPLVGDPAIRRIYSDLGLRATAAFQLKVRGAQYGTIMVHSQNAREFSTAELSFYENVARQAFVALENIGLVDATRQEAERRDVLNQVLQTASSSLDQATILRDVGEVVARRLDMPVLMWTLDMAATQPMSRLRVVSVHDHGGRLLSDVDGSAFGPGLVSHLYDVVDRRRPLQFAITLDDNDRRAHVSNLDFGEGLMDAYAVPLTSRDVVYGVMVLARHEGHEPIDELEREFLRTVGTNLGVALETVDLYQEAQETAAKLREVDELKNQFMANMSHELRTPLNSIIGFSRVMLKGIDGPLTEMQQTDLNAIYDSGRHLLNLINDILDISKINAGKMEVVFEPVDLKAMIQSVMSTALGFVKDKPIKLLTDVPEDLPMIVADSRRIRQVLTNLLGNAGKFTDSGFIKVSALHDDYQVILSVQDTGTGIPHDRIHAVFEQFEQVDSSSTRRYGGTGLGVPLSREFVRMHGGDMWIQETVVGEGTTFCFSLPIGGPEPLDAKDDHEVGKVGRAPADRQASVAMGPPGDRRATERATARVVLTVDDDAGVITLFRRYLEKQGYRVFGLTQGERVVQEAKRLKPYAITLDVILPGKDGWDVIRELKADPETRDIPVIVCSILSDRDKALSMGIADYLVKPISEDLLLQALERIGGSRTGDRRQKSSRVLVVDDNADDRKLLRRILADAEYDVTEASGGAEAIDRIHANRPDLIVLDLMMPEVDGFAVLEHLKGQSETRQIPVVVVTAKELGAEDRARLTQRVEALLNKGLFDQQQLLADVASALGRLSTAPEG